MIYLEVTIDVTDGLDRADLRTHSTLVAERDGITPRCREVSAYAYG
jgi:hypothetical protein